MSPELMLWLSKVVFGGSILLVLYIAYKEYIFSKIRAEEAEIKLGEKENEDLVNSLPDTKLIDNINKELSGLPPVPDSPSPKKPTS